MPRHTTTMTPPRPTDFSVLHTPREEWLAVALSEDAIEPDLPIVDTHMHLWRDARGYEYFASQYGADVVSSGHRVEASVYIECGSNYDLRGPEHLRCVGETVFAARSRAQARDVSGRGMPRVADAIIGHGDLRLGLLFGEQLDAHEEAGDGRFRGVRQGGKWDTDPIARGPVSPGHAEFYRDPSFLRGLTMLGKRGLLFEASVLHPQIPDVTYMASAVPDCSITLVHTGSPVGRGSYAGRADETFRAWRGSMGELAKCPNVSVKLGGLLLTLANFDFLQADRPPTSDELASLWRPYLETCVELFGPDRCMVSSNFPVDKAGVGFRALFNAYKKVCAQMSAAERASVFSHTARRLYRI
ncbi:amidohydrolase family protein [Rhodococcus koreensis]